MHVLREGGFAVLDGRLEIGVVLENAVLLFLVGVVETEVKGQTYDNDYNNSNYFPLVLY
jgi:hypothetical protein